MAFIPVPGVCMFELRFTLDGQHVENTLYARLEDGWSSGQAITMGGKLFDWWVANMAPSLSDQLSLDSVHGTDLENEEGFSVDFIPEASETGVIGGSSLPNNVAICITILTAARGRSGRGRNYICGIPQTHMAQNTLDTADGIAYVAAYNALPAVFDDLVATWVVVSRFTDGLPRDVGLSRTVTGVKLTDLSADSQRRRLPGRGT